MGVKVCPGCNAAYVNGYRGFCCKHCAEEADQYGPEVLRRIRQDVRNAKRQFLAVGYRTQRVTRQSRVKWA
ncbi:MAG TPA: hypothetical protein VH593_06120 [Ktedonobacteraceae bacterium]